jgi:hypothetical protein
MVFSGTLMPQITQMLKSAEFAKSACLQKDLHYKARSDIAPQNPELRTQNTLMRKQIWLSILVSFLLCTMMYGQTSVFSNLSTQDPLRP